MFHTGCIHWPGRYVLGTFQHLSVRWPKSTNTNRLRLGPPITSTSEQKAHVNSSEMATGPFIMKTPLLSTYSQQLWVIAKLSTSNTDGTPSPWSCPFLKILIVRLEVLVRARSSKVSAPRLVDRTEMDFRTSSAAGMLDAILQTTFLCAILMFWLCVYHGLRQVCPIISIHVILDLQFSRESVFFTEWATAYYILLAESTRGGPIMVLSPYFSYVAPLHRTSLFL